MMATLMLTLFDDAKESEAPRPAESYQVALPPLEDIVYLAPGSDEALANLLIDMAHFLMAGAGVHSRVAAAKRGDVTGSQ